MQYLLCFISGSFTLLDAIVASSRLPNVIYFRKTPQRSDYNSSVCEINKVKNVVQSESHLLTLDYFTASGAAAVKCWCDDTECLYRLTLSFPPVLKLFFIAALV